LTVDEFWQDFISAYHLDESETYIDCFHFDLTEEWANKLLELVMSEKKRATSSSLHYFELTGRKLPQVGDYSVVTDWDGNPHCVIKITDVTILPFNEITYEICKREGEDDYLESWQQSHRHFFTEDGKKVGYEFTETMPVVFEDFKVMYKLIDGDIDYNFLYEKHVEIYQSEEDPEFDPIGEAIFRDQFGMSLEEFFEEEDDDD